MQGRARTGTEKTLAFGITVIGKIIKFNTKHGFVNTMAMIVLLYLRTQRFTFSMVLMLISCVTGMGKTLFLSFWLQQKIFLVKFRSSKKLYLSVVHWTEHWATFWLRQRQVYMSVERRKSSCEMHSLSKRSTYNPVLIVEAWVFPVLVNLYVYENNKEVMMFAGAVTWIVQVTWRKMQLQHCSIY